MNTTSGNKSMNQDLRDSTAQHSTEQHSKAPYLHEERKATDTNNDAFKLIRGGGWQLGVVTGALYLSFLPRVSPCLSLSSHGVSQIVCSTKANSIKKGSS